MGDLGMSRTKPHLVATFAFAVLSIFAATIQSALAGATAVPAPIVGAGLPVLAVLGGGYWLVKKLRKRR